MELDKIVKNISSEESGERECGFSDLGLLDEDEQKQAIKLAFEVHIRDDRLLEYNESCDAAAELIQKVKELGYVDKFCGYIKELYELSVNTPTSKARKIVKAVRGVT